MDDMGKGILTVTLNPAIDRTCYVDGFLTGSLNKISASGMDAGGKGINVARTLKRFGLNVVAAGLNGGTQGRILVSLLEKEALPYAFYPVAGETRTNIKIADTRSGVTTELNEPGFTVTESVIDGFMQHLDSLTESADYLVLSGSVPKGAKPDIYAKLVEKYRTRGLRVLLDADNEPLAMGVRAGPYAVKPNLAELERLSGKRLASDHEVACEGKKLLASGIELVAITLGADGVIVLRGEEVWKATPFPITPVCTTGSGDAALAAMIYALAHNKTLSDLAALMTCAGTLSAAEKGTGTCSLEDVLQNAARIRLEKMDL